MRLSGETKQVKRSEEDGGGVHSASPHLRGLDTRPMAQISERVVAAGQPHVQPANEACHVGCMPADRPCNASLYSLVGVDVMSPVTTDKYVQVTMSFGGSFLHDHIAARFGSGSSIALVCAKTSRLGSQSHRSFAHTAARIPLKLERA